MAKVGACLGLFLKEIGFADLSRKTTRASLEDTSDEGAAVLGRAGESFDFDEDAPCATSFVGCSALEAQLEPVMDFIRDQA